MKTNSLPRNSKWIILITCCDDKTGGKDELMYGMKKVALIADIESMYCRVRVKPQDEKMLRFLWWKDGNYIEPPQHFCMTSHVFGAKSSACIASFAIHCAIDEAQKRGQISNDSAEYARKNFYVDDFLASTDSIQDGIRIAHEITDTVMKGGFRLKKWLSNERKSSKALKRTNGLMPSKSYQLTTPFPTNGHLASCSTSKKMSFTTTRTSQRNQ